jgi:Family of unknown function (DUF6152)
MLRKILLTALVIGACVQASAHHGISNWDLNKDLSITGTLVRIDLINPHSWIYVDVKGADGKAVHWRCEMRSVNSLRRSGWTTDMFKIGSTLTITGSPERHKPAYCYLGTIVFADGSHMDRYGQRQLAATKTKQAPQAHAMRTATGVPNLAGEWAAEQRVMSDPRGRAGSAWRRRENEAGRRACRAKGISWRARVAGIPGRGSGARGVGSSHSGETHGNGTEGIAQLQSRFARESTSALPAHQHPVRLDVRFRGQPRHAGANAY